MQHFFAMERLSVYNIAFKGLKEGVHEYDYHIGKSFFDHFEGSLVEDGDIELIVVLEKRSSFMSLHLKFSGNVTLTCDRCLEPYNQAIGNDASVFVKFGETLSEEGDDVIWLLPEENQINIAQTIYEYIIVSIPLRHVHPNDKKGGSSCDPAMLKKLEEYSRHESEKSDERWGELKKLLNNN